MWFAIVLQMEKVRGLDICCYTKIMQLLIIHFRNGMSKVLKTGDVELEFRSVDWGTSIYLRAYLKDTIILDEIADFLGIFEKILDLITRRTFLNLYIFIQIKNSWIKQFHEYYLLATCKHSYTYVFRDSQTYNSCQAS